MADSDSRQGARYSTPEMLKYLEQLHAEHDAGLKQAFEAPEREGMRPIQVAPSEGKMLELFMRLVGAKKVVEVGTLAGYSAIRLARALPDGGKLWSLELEEKHARVARANIAAAGLEARVEVCVGPALDVLPTLEKHGPFDAVFIDADKERYDLYGRWAAKHTRAGGLLLGDNAYYFGKLMEQSPEAAAMRRFHEEAKAAYDTVCVPTPDGMLLGIRR
jgi:caffeoyl-CoA O-methyltransferase